jgi:metallo-beta-lactamase family protein
MQLEFFGAAGEITGSCHILRINGAQVLLDCGLIQGGRKDEARNRDPFPFDAAQIDAVVLSHAHIDHSGRLPLLAKRGFEGPVFTHRASADLCGILLRDSASLAERDAERENRRRERQGRKAVKPLYSVADADEAVNLLEGIAYETPQEVVPGVTVTFHDAGHIMGSAIVKLRLEERGVHRTVVFSGDLGQYDTPILRDPAIIQHADLVLMESTYGGRQHRNRQDTVAELGQILAEARAAGGVVLIPAFAIGRSQELLYWFGKNFREWGMDAWRIFLDSPMAIAASHVYWDYPHLYDEEATKLRRDSNEMPPLPNLALTESAEESININTIKHGAIVIAGSGMCTGGRIVHHLKHRLWRKQTHLIIVGYQAPGTLGRRLVERREHVRIHGQTIRVAAQIHTLGGFSAHGDEADLSRWYGGFGNRPPVFLVHGEPDAADALKRTLKAAWGASVTRAQPGLRVDLTKL